MRWEIKEVLAFLILIFFISPYKGSLFNGLFFICAGI
jgi:hypothetical protein